MEELKVFVVEQCTPYEGANLLAIYFKQKDAQTYADQLQGEDTYYDYEVTEWTIK